MILKFKRYCAVLHNKNSEYDRKVSDIYHKIEFNCKNNKELLQLAKELKKTLKERRKVKNKTQEMFNFISQPINIEKLKKEIKELDNQKQCNNV